MTHCSARHGHRCSAGSWRRCVALAACLALQAAVPAATAAPAAAPKAQPPELPPETLTTVPSVAGHAARVYVADVAISHIADGRLRVFDARAGKLLGMINTGFAGNFALSAKADEVYGAKFRELTYQADGKSYKEITEIAKDPEALKVGQRLFLQNCSQCHGSDARGGRGFPNLTDSDWLYGGTPEQVHQSVAEGHRGQMPAWGAAFGEEKVKDVTNYVLSLSGKKADAERVSRGKETFAATCAACHGADGKGNQAIGAPNLTDNIWLYGGDRATIRQTLRFGRAGQMPAWEQQLGEQRINLLAAYVYSLSPHQ